MSAVLEAGVRIRPRVHWTDRTAHVLLAVVALTLIAFLGGPLLAVLAQSVEDSQGRFLGVDNFFAYFETPALAESLWNSIWVSLLVTAVVVPAAFVFAYAIARSCMPIKAVFRTIALAPLLAPSLLSAIAFIYWFGNQGVLKDWMHALGIASIYGAPGIVLAEIFAVFPHALMILVTALSLADARLYEAADALGTSRARKFFTITLPGAKYGIASAAMVSFTLVITDFGIRR
jgi:iron(III) transport system permease protein